MKQLGICLILILLGLLTACGGQNAGSMNVPGNDGNNNNNNRQAPRQTPSPNPSPDQNPTPNPSPTPPSADDVPTGPTSGDQCLGNSTVCRWQGPYVSTVTEPARYIYFKGVRNGNFRTAKLSLDVVPTGFTTQVNGKPGLHNFMWFTINKRHNDLLGGSAIKSDKSMMLRHGLDIGAGNKSKEIQKFKQFEAGKKYRFEYTWDAAGKTAELIVKDAATGNQLMKFNKFPPNKTEFVLRGKDFVGVGLSDNYAKPDASGAAGPEVPSYGWEYSNVRIELVP